MFRWKQLLMQLLLILPVLECWIYILVSYMVTIALQKLQNEIDMGIELHACSLLVDLGQSQGQCQVISEVVYHV